MLPVKLRPAARGQVTSVDDDDVHEVVGVAAGLDAERRDALGANGRAMPGSPYPVHPRPAARGPGERRGFAVPAVLAARPAEGRLRLVVKVTGSSTWGLDAASRPPSSPFPVVGTRSTRARACFKLGGCPTT